MITQLTLRVPYELVIVFGKNNIFINVERYFFQEFLLRDEFVPLCSGGKKSGSVQESVVVEGEREMRAPVVMLTGVSARWVQGGTLTLSDINLDIRVGQLVAVIGTVGCGKVRLSSLLRGGCYFRNTSVSFL